MIAHIPSPFGEFEQVPARIVIHAMGEFIGFVDTRYATEFLRVKRYSAHSLISPSGVNIRTRKDKQGGHHAKGFNVNSLGIEFLVPGVHEYTSFLNAIKHPYLSDAQYHAGVEQVKEWVTTYGITKVDRHSDLSPDRKHDPGTGFPFSSFLSDIGF